MLRTAVTTALLCLLGIPTPAGAEVLPRPPEMEPQVEFWRRIYSQVDSDGGLLHDSEHLGVVYEVLQVPPGLSYRARERYIERAKKKYVDALRLLGRGRRSGLGRLEKHVLALWPPDVSNATLRRAASHVRFQRGQADKFREGVIRAGLWEPFIEEVFAQEGVPMEIAALPHVESSFNPRAYSSAGAAGLWQFTRSTGRLYMRVDHVIDERFDPYIASRAAARLLQDNYRELRRWPLAITAYNHGRGGMARAVRTLGTRDIATIVRRYKGRTFGFASRNFYAELLAAIDVEREAERHFGPLEKLDPDQLELVELDHYYRVDSLERALGIASTELREHNLSLQSPVWRGQKYVPRGFRLRVPRSPSGVSAMTALASIPPGERYARQKRDATYRVQRGDTLSQIARRYAVSQSELVSLNGLRSRHSIRAGQLLRLPGVEAPTAVVAVEPRPADGVYRVRRGDTLSTIAARFRTSEEQLAAANRLANRNRLYAGQTLRVPGPEARPPAPEPVAVAASRPLPPSPPRVDGKPPIVVTVRPGAPAPARTETARRAAARAAGETAEGVAPVAAEGAEDVATEGAADVAAEGVADVAAVGAPAVVPVSSPDAAPAGDAPSGLDGLDLSVDAGGHITVEPGETLGHYADWLQLPTSRLRRLNRLTPRTAIVIGQRVRLDFSQVSRDEFDARRRAYHEALRRDFFEHFRVAGTRVHVLRPGDTLWSLSRRHQSVPIWLLRDYNPDVDLSLLQPGERIRIPRLERRRT